MALAPIAPPAPPRLSTTKAWPSSFCRPSAAMRPMMSVEPPGGNGIISVTGFAGHDCARPDAIDALMHALAEIREEMRPAVAEEPPRLQETEPLHDPRVASELHQFSGGTVISFRHPSLGWIPFLLPSVRRQSLAQAFKDQEAAWSELHLFSSQKIGG